MAKMEVNNYSPKYDFPMYLISMSRSKMDRALQDKVFQKLRNYFHCSTPAARDMLLMIRELIKKDKRLATKLVIALQLDENELSYIAESPDYAGRVFDEAENRGKGEDEKDEITAYTDKPAVKEPEKEPPPPSVPKTTKKDKDKPKDKTKDEDPQGGSQSSLIDFGRDEK